MGEVCTPKFQTSCATVEIPVKKIVDKEQCQNITHTVCTVEMSMVENSVCVYSYMEAKEDRMATTVEVVYTKECKVQMVTVCQPPPGYGYHSLGHNYCEEVSQETCYNIPGVKKVETPVSVSYPEPRERCEDRPISLPRLTCEDLTEEKCIKVPEVMEATETVEKCTVTLGEPECKQIELSLPKQVCVEIVYGHAFEEHRMEDYPRV